MDRSSFYLLFVPGLTVAAVAVAFAFMALAMRQGPIRPETKRGLASLAGVLVVLAGLVAFGLRGHYTPVYPHPAVHRAGKA
ncbi:MAG TPA: hypothetical protein VG245_06890 [Candidatus Dormibacteraeota bacterium]|nr:hypothetical protein [Candidatus Dormibacteraeota bacterium]